MDQACTNALRTVRNAIGGPAVDLAWPFSLRPARRETGPSLEPAALELLAATAQEWGLAARGPWTRQVG
jgi:hypothetical protein